MRSLRIARARQGIEQQQKPPRVVPRIDGVAGHYLARRSRSGAVAEPVDVQLITGR